VSETTVVKVTAGERMMDNWAFGQLLDWVAGKKGNEKTKDQLRQELANVTAESAGPNPSPVELLLPRGPHLTGLPSATSRPGIRGRRHRKGGCRWSNPNTGNGGSTGPTDGS
jgi:hypothetical protein